MRCASTLHVCVHGNDLNIPVWTSGEDTLQLRLVCPLPLLELTEDLQQAVWSSLGIRAVLCLQQTCRALRAAMKSVREDESWRKNALKLEMLWCIKGPSARERTVELGAWSERYAGRYELAEFGAWREPCTTWHSLTEGSAVLGKASVRANAMLADQFDAAQPREMVDPAYAMVLWPCHAVLASEDHLLVCQTYESHSGGTDNLRLHMLNPLAAAAPGAATYSASCGTAHRACVSSVRFDYWLSRLPQYRCWKASHPAKVEVRGEHVFVLNCRADREEVEVRSLGSGEVVRRIDVSCRACPDRPVEYRQWFAHDMALGWTQRVTQGAMQGEAPHGMEPASDREVYVLTSYAQRSAILAFGADGSPRSRRLLPFRASASELLLPDSAAEPGAVLDLRVSCIAAHRGLIYAIWHPFEGSIGRYVVLRACDGAFMRAWPADVECRVGGLCVDATALYAAVEAMSDGSRAVLAYSHAGTPLASIDIGRPDLPPVRYADGRVHVGTSKLSIDPEGRVCVALEEAHEVQCLRFVE